MGTYDERPPQTAAEHAEYAQQLDADAAALWASVPDGRDGSELPAEAAWVRASARFMLGRAEVHATLANAKANMAALDELVEAPADSLLVVLDAIPALRALHQSWLSQAGQWPRTGDDVTAKTLRDCAEQLMAAVSGR